MNPTGSSRIALLGVLALAACQAAGPAPLSDADRTAIREMGTQFTQVFLSGNVAEVGQFYAEDATLLPPNAPTVTGREAIVAFMQTFPPLTEFTITDNVIEGFGDLAYVSGTYHMVLAVGEGVTVTDSGKYLDIRQRQADGSWLYVMDMFSSSIPLPAPPMP